jgi:membrane associated rhomboid family serine protease
MLPPLPPATRALLLINIAVFLLQQVAGATLLKLFALWPPGSGQFQVWQLVTYGFLHGSWTHIFFNMFALFMFGGMLERLWGARRMLIYFMVCIIAAGLTQLAVLAAQSNAPAEGYTIGASGGVFGVLLAFAWYFPRQRLYVIPIPIPLPAWLFVTIYGLLELLFGVTGVQSDVAHFAHLGGMLGGALCILYWRARNRFNSGLPRA